MICMMMDTNEEKRKFEILYEKYRYLMFKVAKEVLADNYLAEDAVHDAFFKVAKNMEKIKETESPETKRFLIVITKNAAIDIYRKKRMERTQEVFLEELEEKEEPFICMNTDTGNSILEILKNLPEKYRDVFLLKYADRLENREIAERLRITEENVRQRIARGKGMIQEAIDKSEGKANG